MFLNPPIFFLSAYMLICGAGQLINAADSVADVGNLVEIYLEPADVASFVVPTLWLSQLLLLFLLLFLLFLLELQ